MIKKIDPKLIAKVKQIPIANFLPPQRNHRNGGYQTYSCPFHKDRKPSLAVYEHDNSFYCFSCGRHGDNITFIMELCKASFKEAVEFLEKHEH